MSLTPEREYAEMAIRTALRPHVPGPDAYTLGYKEHPYSAEFVCPGCGVRIPAREVMGEA